MTSKERHDNRYKRRREKRMQKKQMRTDNICGIETAMSYEKLYQSGKKCCSGVRWKQSIQNFERHLFSRTAVCSCKIQNGVWKPSKYTSFTLCERGKIRPIDAPKIQDRQIHKCYSKNVLLPLYRSDMIYNNGASLKGKGLSFSRNMLIKDLHSFYRHYKNSGNVILMDFKQFFPSAPHTSVYKRHNNIILDQKLKHIGDQIVASNHKDIGMPLGVEPSQIEMVALPSPLDNYIKCQLGIKHIGHYMDDYYILVPPHINSKNLLHLIIEKAASIGLNVNTNKTKICPLTKPFKYCKAKYRMTETGKIIVNGNRDSIKRARKKIMAFREKISHQRMDYEDLWTSINGIFAYLNAYNDHNRVLKLRRLFYSKFGFSPEFIENFKRNGIQSEIYCTQKI